MKKCFSLILVSMCMFILVPMNSYAGQTANQLGTCLTDSLTGKERKMLAKWMFFAMSEHPELSPYANISDKEKEDVQKFVGKLLTRLLAEDCPRQTKAALKENGNVALGAAFETVGKVAMQELMTNKNVTASIAGFDKYVDKVRLNFMEGK